MDIENQENLLEDEWRTSCNRPVIWQQNKQWEQRTTEQNGEHSSMKLSTLMSRKAKDKTLQDMTLYRYVLECCLFLILLKRIWHFQSLLFSKCLQESYQTSIQTEVFFITKTTSQTEIKYKPKNIYSYFYLPICQGYWQ